jgi:dihydropteroate synthase
MLTWQTSRFQIDLSRPRILGIVNVTPDSFSDGGLHASTRDALSHCEALLREGADILDIGGESTRPGAVPLNLEQERQRVIPVVLEAVKFGVPISVDTYKPELMAEVLDLGADIINDVWALRWSSLNSVQSAVDVVAGHPACGVCLMHMHGDPQTMQIYPLKGDALEPVAEFLAERSRLLIDRGVHPSRICLDPGIGFGKTVAQNFSLLARQDELLKLGFVLLAGWSRKSSLGAVSGASANDRMAASVAAALLAVQNGARLLRVHDVQATSQALKVLAAENQARAIKRVSAQFKGDGE